MRKALAVLGVSEAQLEAVSSGEEKPRAVGDTEQAYAENRRADIVDSDEQYGCMKCRGTVLGLLAGLGFPALADECRGAVQNYSPRSGHWNSVWEKWKRCCRIRGCCPC